jgi:hypothetical protein
MSVSQVIVLLFLTVHESILGSLKGRVALEGGVPLLKEHGVLVGLDLEGHDQCAGGGGVDRGRLGEGSPPCC